MRSCETGVRNTKKRDLRPLSQVISSNENTRDRIAHGRRDTPRFRAGRTSVAHVFSNVCFFLLVILIGVPIPGL